MRTASPKLSSAFKELADFSFEICATRCHRIGSCCSIEYCLAAMQTAKEDFGVDLVPIEGSKLPLFDESTKTCSAAPHFRPMCAAHQCDISGVGFVKNDPGQKLTKKYFRLYDAANHAYAQEIEFGSNGQTDTNAQTGN